MVIKQSHAWTIKDWFGHCGIGHTQHVLEAYPFFCYDIDSLRLRTIFPAFFAYWWLCCTLEGQWNTKIGSQVRDDYKPVLHWTTKMSLNYFYEGITWIVNKPSWIVRNDIKLSLATHNDMKLPLHRLKSHYRNEGGCGCSPFFLNGKTHVYFVEWSILPSYRTHETLFGNVIPYAHAELLWLHGTDRTCSFWRMRSHGPSVGRTSSRKTGSYDPTTCLPTVHMHVDTLYDCGEGICRRTISSTSRLGRQYADNSWATTLSYIAWWFSDQSRASYVRGGTCFPPCRSTLRQYDHIYRLTPPCKTRPMEG